MKKQGVLDDWEDDWDPDATKKVAGQTKRKRGPESSLGTWKERCAKFEKEIDSLQAQLKLEKQKNEFLETLLKTEKTNAAKQEAAVDRLQKELDCERKDSREFLRAEFNRVTELLANVKQDADQARRGEIGALKNQSQQSSAAAAMMLQKMVEQRGWKQNRVLSEHLLLMPHQTVEQLPAAEIEKSINMFLFEELGKDVEKAKTKYVQTAIEIAKLETSVVAPNKNDPMAKEQEKALRLMRKQNQILGTQLQHRLSTQDWSTLQKKLTSQIATL